MGSPGLVSQLCFIVCSLKKKKKTLDVLNMTHPLMTTKVLDLTAHIVNTSVEPGIPLFMNEAVKK